MGAKLAAPSASAKKTPFSALQGLTNKQIFDMVNAYSSGQFNRAISNGTVKWFTSQGCDMLTTQDVTGGGLVNQFLDQAFMMVFEKFDVPRVNTKWEDSGIVEHYSHGFGGLYKRVAGQIPPEVSPGFLPENANSADPDKYSPDKPRFVEDKERFSKIGNDPFQNVITYQDFAIRPTFLSEDGLSGYISLKANGVYQSYALHKEVMYAKVFMHSLTDGYKYNLKPTQILKVDYPIDGTMPTETQSKALFNAVRKQIHLIEGVVGTTGEFNEAGYESAWNRDDFVLMLRTGIEDDAITNIPTEFFRDSAFKFPFDKVTNFNNFGDMEAYADAEFKTRLYPVYSADGWGSVVANTWNTSENTLVTNTSGQIVDDGTNVHFKDPHARVLGFITQKGRIVDERQSGLIVQPHYNPRTLATSLIASDPAGSVVTDYYYNNIIIVGNQA